MAIRLLCRPSRSSKHSLRTTTGGDPEGRRRILHAALSRRHGLDEVLPWQGAQVPALIDIACGSGAFMTEAFRRVAYREYSSRRRPPTYDQLRALLVDHIFGNRQ